jgi:hypothetical protein
MQYQSGIKQIHWHRTRLFKACRMDCSPISMAQGPVTFFKSLSHEMSQSLSIVRVYYTTKSCQAHFQVLYVN